MTAHRGDVVGSVPTEITRRSGPKVYLSYLHPNDVAASFHISITELILNDRGRYLDNWARVRSSGTGIPESRNMVAKKLLESDCEWLFFVDADMGFAPDTLDRLMEVADPTERPIVGGLCFAYKDQGFDSLNGIRSMPLPTIFDYVQHDDGVWRFTGRTHYPLNTVVPCAATGAACVVIHRSVFEKIREEHGETWFDRIPSPDGLLGEDISFFMRSGALDIPCHVHTGVRTNHQKTIWVSETDFWSSFDAPWSTEECTVVVPTVAERVGNIPRLAHSLRATTGMAEPLFVADDEDHAAELKQYGRTVIQPGKFPVKVNAGYRATDTPWMLMVGDDVRFRPGWLDHAQHIARAYKANVIGTNDLANRRVMAGEHATHPMIRRDYIEEVGASWDGPGVVCHQGYRHWFCDDEIVAAARQRETFQTALGSIVEHVHPIAGKAETDAVYEANDRYASQDRDLFRKRLEANS